MSTLPTKCPTCSNGTLYWESDGNHVDGVCKDCGYEVLEEESHRELQEEVDFWREETHYWRDEVEFLCGEVFDLHQENQKVLGMLDNLVRLNLFQAPLKDIDEAVEKIRSYLVKIDWKRPRNREYMDTFTKEREEN